MATNYNEMIAEMDSLDGKDGSQLVMVINGYALTEAEFNRCKENDELPKRIAKKGFIPTHKETWTYLKKMNRFQQWALYRINFQQIEL